MISGSVVRFASEGCVADWEVITSGENSGISSASDVLNRNIICSVDIGSHQDIGVASRGRHRDRGRAFDHGILIIQRDGERRARACGDIRIWVCERANH